jgi:uncharacterized C2H2 Zn-finger protein
MMGIRRALSHRLTRASQDCGQGFTRAFNLDVHRRTHSTERPFPCLSCDKAFKTSSNLYRHEKTAHASLAAKPAPAAAPPASPAPTAAVPNPNPPTPAALRVATPIIAKATTVTCGQCAKPFSNKANLQRHVQGVHQQKRDFPCDFPECGRAFKQAQHLTQHKAVHTNVRIPSDATSRTLGFGTNCLHRSCAASPRATSLATRRRAAEPPRAPQAGLAACGWCYKTYSSAVNLAKHVRIHTRENLFACDLCDSQFVQKHHLRDHRRSHLKAGAGAAAGADDEDEEEEEEALLLLARAAKGQWWQGAVGETKSPPPPPPGGPPLPPPTLLSCAFCFKVLWTDQGLRNHEKACEFKQQEKAREAPKASVGEVDGPSLPQQLCHWKPAHAFTCDTCDEPFSTPAELVFHSRLHAEAAATGASR